MLELRPDPHEWAPRIERLAHDLEQRGACLEDLDQALVDIELLAAEVFEEAGGSADVEALALRRERLPEERLDRLQERPLGHAETRIVEPPEEQMAAELEARHALVEVLRCPVRETRIDRVREAVDTLRHAPGRGDDDDHRELRLKQEHLDVAHGRRA